jgi:hypothetical protein
MSADSATRTIGCSARLVACWPKPCDFSRRTRITVAATVHAKSGTVDRQQKQDKLEFISFRKTGQKLHARDSTFDNNAQSARESEYGTRSRTRAAKFDLDHRPVSKNGSTGRCVSTFYRKTSERVRPQ